MKGLIGTDVEYLSSRCFPGSSKLCQESLYYLGCINTSHRFTEFKDKRNHLVIYSDFLYVTDLQILPVKLYIKPYVSYLTTAQHPESHAVLLGRHQPRKTPPLPLMDPVNC